jgi:hypothetical protein
MSATATILVPARSALVLVVRTKQMTPVASSSATPASEHVLDQRGASFETAAPRLPQDEGFS